MEMAMTMVEDAGRPNEDQFTPDEKTATFQLATTDIGNTEGDASLPLVRVTPPIVIEKITDMVRTQSTPPLSPDGGVLPAPDQFNEETTRRMEWIMRLSMESLLPTLPPEQRKLIEGTKDLRQLIASLFETWQIFRSTDGRENKTRKIAKSMYDKLKSNFTNNELFERFWARKLVAQKDEAAWGRFKSTVTTILDQVSAVDKILNSMNMCNVYIPCSVADGRLWLLRKLFLG